MFTKKDLQSGMMVQTHENKVYMVIKNEEEERIISSTGWLRLEDYEEDLKFRGEDYYFTIDKVFKFVPWCHFKIDKEDNSLIWERFPAPNKLDDLEKQFKSIQEQINQLREELWQDVQKLDKKGWR